ncbi:hypothetical protein [Streptomyces showdoensis]|uniref:vWA-MoxR associated protein middle region 2 domain-containing protein n=1 Tax=Streptomyces showdoensis TaxID=68268 RepID=A0A2P2GEG3_STREW|nr:hypothetical protein [Streptomyces showdoensis]KKZ69229.1 hypothetical protein VO63_35380 [Streptomyces showdoensis]
MTRPRHVLVIGAQCPGLGLLDELEQATHALHDTLTTPWAGACEKDQPHGPTLLYGGRLTRSGVEDAVRRAGRAAAEAGAVLVLGLLGHGMAAGTRLYFMAGDSRAEDPLSAVDVGSLLTALLDTPGLDGVVALVDTCHANNAHPDLGSLANGIRRGDTRFSLLLGSGAQEEAYELRFSRTVVKVLHSGIADAGETLVPSAVVRAVREDGGAAGQGVHHTDHDGAQFADGALWLARNARHATGGAGSLLGPVGRAALDRALGAADPTAADTVAHPGDLDALRARLDTLSAPQRDWASKVVTALDHAVRTQALLTGWPGDDLTSALLRRALAEACPAPLSPLPESSGGELLRDAVEYLLLRAPRFEQRPTAPLAAFVAVLATETRVEPRNHALRGWAFALDAVIDLNDAFARLAERGRETRLRLVVSLHAAVGDDWPESLAAWLLDDGTVREHEEFPCPAQDRTGVERTLVGVLRWATRHADALDTPLRRVEIAAPAPLLATWRPEETDFGMRLGDLHDVVLRWSDRIQPPDHLWWINDQARTALKAMEGRGEGSRVDWLGEADTRRADELHERLRRSAPRSRAVALEHRPAHLKDMMEILLASSPIVLWPNPVQGTPEAQGAGGPDTRAAAVPEPVRRSVDTHWHLLPAEFSRAYREHRRSGPGADDGACGHADTGRRHLAGLRTVWDGLEWLDFCKWFDREHTAREQFSRERFPTEGESPA